MGVDYSLQTIQHLENLFDSQEVLRPRRRLRYEPETELQYRIRGVFPPREGQVKFRIERFVGGGYAGQVYRVKALEVEPEGEPIIGLQVGQVYALKILVPPNGFARWFRNVMFGLAFQAPYSLQVNPDAAQAGALWQKLIRRGAWLRFGSEDAVVDILATFIDRSLGSCGEISEWVEGRIWRFEVDDNLDARRKWKVGDPGEGLGSPEYRAKRVFMANLVNLMHDMGASELARQYEWWTLKSQPNALKRIASDPEPTQGLVGVDFRAGLALLPFLPQCPADFKLILQGVKRGRLVQFDKGDIEKLENFVEEQADAFAGMEGAVEELKAVDQAYRDSLLDITNHHLKLLTSPRLRASIIKGFVKSWNLRKIIDDKWCEKLLQSRFLALVYWILGLIPFLGNFFRRLGGHAVYRQHYKQVLTSLSYYRRAFRAHVAEALIRWHRAGRISESRAEGLARQPVRCLLHLPLSISPPKMHRFFSDRRFFLQSLDYIFARPFRLYFKAEVREEWLRDMVSQGQKEGMLTEREAANVQSQIKEPFIQKYLKSLAVHVCTLPITQIVSVIVAFIYIRMHPELSWQEASVHAGLILGFFQVIPISPGSLVRGLYVTFLVIRERNFQDYSLAFFISFFKYIGYLAFPIQMAYRYPDLARFMAGRWAIGVSHIVPVFGERGALLEHAVFDLFYNYPLTLRRRFRRRREFRAGLKPRYWHVPLSIIIGTAVLGGIDTSFFQLRGYLPQFSDLWWLALWIPLLAAGAVSIWAGGSSLARRFMAGMICGVLIGVLYAALSGVESRFISLEGAEVLTELQFTGQVAVDALWRAFLFAVVAV
ncbi:MAG: hypothetical protein AMJ73_00275, partial [candidate division Zixibacteria bacterium SM1_73]